MKLAEQFKKIDIFYVLLSIYVLWLISLNNRHTGGMSDFDIFFKAGERLQTGENIFGPPHFNDRKYFYSVFFAVFLSLFKWMDINTVKLFWFILNAGLIVRVLFLLKSYVLSASVKPGLVLFIVLLITGRMMLVNQVFNQMSILILWTMVESFHQLLKGRILLAVTILCLGINIKVMPLMLAPYFVYLAKKPLQMALLGVTMLAVFAFLPALFIGWDYNLFLLCEWWKTLNPASDIHVMQTYEPGFMDISSMVTKFLSGEVVVEEPQLNIADLPKSYLFIIVNVIRLTLFLLAGFLALKLKKPVAGIDHRFITASAFMALVPLCFPHQREYSFVCSLPLLTILTALTIYTRKWLNYIIFFLLVMLTGMMVWIDYAGAEAVLVFAHYRLITMGMTGFYLWYIFLCWRIRKQEIE